MTFDDRLLLTVHPTGHGCDHHLQWNAQHRRKLPCQKRDIRLLAFLFAIYGLLGTTPAVTALVLYALLPIVLNTFTGLREVPAEVLEAADGVGMSSRQRLRLVEIPLASPVMIAGIRTATVLTVGIATLCTYIGAGGLGDFIARGLARNDPRLTLLGAVPAAIMAVALSLVIRWIERAVKRG